MFVWPYNLNALNVLNALNNPNNPNNYNNPNNPKTPSPLYVCTGNKLRQVISQGALQCAYPWGGPKRISCVVVLGEGVVVVVVGETTTQKTHASLKNFKNEMLPFTTFTPTTPFISLKVVLLPPGSG